MPEERMNKMTFGRRIEQKIDTTIGPGQYNSIDLGLNSTYESSINYTMRGRSKDPKFDNYVGPGQYEIPEEKMPNITFKGKHDRPVEVTIGPGHYNSTDLGKDSNHEAGI